MWWDILKNAKISGKAKGKGSSFDASKIKINIDKPDDCCEKFWLKIQEFSNYNIIVISSLQGLKNIQDYDFKGIGHRLYENQTEISPSPSENPCEDSALLYIHLLKYAREIGSIPDTGKMTDMTLPFKLKNYKNSEDIDTDIREWHQLKNSFFAEWKKLIRDIRKCPDLVAAIKEQGEAFY